MHTRTFKKKNWNWNSFQWETNSSFDERSEYQRIEFMTGSVWKPIYLLGKDFTKGLTARLKSMSIRLTCQLNLQEKKNEKKKLQENHWKPGAVIAWQ